LELTLYSGSGLTAGRVAGSFHSRLSTGTNSGMLAGCSTGAWRRMQTVHDCPVNNSSPCSGDIATAEIAASVTTRKKTKALRLTALASITL